MNNNLVDEKLRKIIFESSISAYESAKDYTSKCITNNSEGNIKWDDFNTSIYNALKNNEDYYVGILRAGFAWNYLFVVSKKNKTLITFTSSNSFDNMYAEVKERSHYIMNYINFFNKGLKNGQSIMQLDCFEETTNIKDVLKSISNYESVYDIESVKKIIEKYCLIIMEADKSSMTLNQLEARLLDRDFNTISYDNLLLNIRPLADYSNVSKYEEDNKSMVKLRENKDKIVKIHKKDIKKYENN